MPELPEVDYAAGVLRRAVTGKTILRVRCHHRAHARRLGPSARRSVAGVVVAAVRRRGKVQLIELGDGRALRVHFRMTGAWAISRVRDPRPTHARVSIEFTDGTVAILVDPRALSRVELHARPDDPEGLGPEPDDPRLTPSRLRSRLATRRSPIKVVLLDQRVVAGVGNIYAAEALWRARIDPQAPASSLSIAQSSRLLRAVRSVLSVATGARYRGAEGSVHPSVYDREGKPCPRCQTAIVRITQGGRSTFACPQCQQMNVPTPPSHHRARQAPDARRQSIASSSAPLR